MTGERQASVDRRAFLEATGGAAGAAALGLGGCTGVRRSVDVAPGAFSTEALGEHLRHLDALLEAASTEPFISDFVAERVGAPDPELGETLALADCQARRTVRALTLTSMVLDLPEPMRRSPEVLERIEGLSPEMDAAVLHTAHLFSSCPEEDLRGVEASLRQDPTLAMRVCELVDRRGLENGLSRSSRRRLRVLGRRVTNTLRDTPLTSLVRQCESVVAEAIVQHGTALGDDVQRRLAAEARAFWTPADEGAWAMVKSPEEGGSSTSTEAHALPCIDPMTEGYTITGRCEAANAEGARALSPSGASHLDEHGRLELEYRMWRANRGRLPDRPGQPSSEEMQDSRRIRAGSSTLGVGIGLMIIGGATFPLSEGITAFLITIGGIVLIVGIILLAIGASRRAARRRGEL